jgi:hypothetical protein
MPSAIAMIEENAVLARIYARMPVDVQLSFTPEQMAALGEATYDGPAQHKVAIRKTVSFFGRRYYLALFAGRDRRHGRGTIEKYADEFRADWRYVVMILLLLAAGPTIIVGTILYVWLLAVSYVGGPYRVPSVTEFLPQLTR